MNFLQFLLILRARYRIALAVLVVTVLATGLISVLWPKSYQATSTLVLNYKGTDPLTGVTLPAQLMPGYMATQVDLITNITTALKVVDELALTHDPEARADFDENMEGEADFRQWLALRLLKQLDVVPARDSSVLSISATASDATTAAAVANAFATAYREVSVEVKTDPVRRAADYYEKQLHSLRERVEETQEKLSRFQQENGIVVTDNRVDNEYARLTALSTQLAQAQAQTLEAVSRMRASAANRSDTSPDIFSNSMIQSLKIQLAQAEQRLQSVAQSTTEEHLQYQTAKAAVDSLRRELQRQVKANAGALASNAQVLQERESDLRKAVEDQKELVLALNRKRDALKVLNTELDGAQKYYDAALQRYLQTNLEGQSNQADVVEVSPATRPLKPASPKILLNIALSLVIGAFLGTAFAMLAELLDRRVRSTADLLATLGAPVFGVLTADSARKRRRLRAPTFLIGHRPSAA